MQMRESVVLKKLRAGQVANCMKVNYGDPRVTEMAALRGFDCVWVGLEHIPNDWSTIENQIRSAKIHNVDTVVRIPRGSYSDYIKPFEADASGIMVPHVMSLEDAKKVVWQTRFHPIGRRPLDGGGADGCYCGIPTKEYIKFANEQKFVAIQIEDPEPLEELDEIAKLDGIDIIFFGPGDFSHSIGVPGQGDHPLVAEAREQIAKVARANGKFAGTVCGPDKIQEIVDMGYRFINCGADVVGLLYYFEEIAAAFDGIKT